MLAIAVGLVLGVLIIPLTEIKRLVDMLYFEEARERFAARTIQLRFRARQKSRRFRTWWRQRPDPTSVMGRATAWDADYQWHQDLLTDGAPLHWRRNYSPPMSILDWMNLPFLSRPQN